MNEYDEHRYDKTYETRKGYDQHQKLELNPPEKKKNDESWASRTSSWKTPGKNIDGKEWRYFITNKMDTWLRILNHWRKRLGGREKQRQFGDGWNKHRWEELILDLADIEMIGSTWREAHRLKRIDMTISIIMKD